MDLNYIDQFFSEQTYKQPNLMVKDLASLERDHIQEVLRQTNWKIEGPGGAAAVLDIHPSTLRFRLKKFKLKRPA